MKCETVEATCGILRMLSPSLVPGYVRCVCVCVCVCVCLCVCVCTLSLSVGCGDYLHYGHGDGVWGVHPGQHASPRHHRQPGEQRAAPHRAEGVQDTLGV